VDETRKNRLLRNGEREQASTAMMFFIDSRLKSLQANVRLGCAASWAEALLPVFQMSISWISTRGNYNRNSCFM